MKKKSFWIIIGVALLMGAMVSGCGEASTVPGKVLNSEDQFTVETELVLEIPQIDEYFRVMQGGCVSDKYAWFVIVSAEDYNDDENKEAYVIKYDRETMTEVARSEKLKLGHGNDVAYLQETNELYVLHVYRRMISVLDADTLTVKETKQTDSEFKFNCYAIDYNASKDCFVTAHQTAAMVIYDRDLKVKDATLALDTTLVTQGICADDKYVYHVFYSTKSNTVEPENMIFVVDWYGKIVTKIPIGLKEIEPENISLVGDTFYIGFNNGKGGLVYTAKLVKVE